MIDIVSFGVVSIVVGGFGFVGVYEWARRGEERKSYLNIVSPFRSNTGLKHIHTGSVVDG